jgi:phage-related protein
VWSPVNYVDDDGTPVVENLLRSLDERIQRGIAASTEVLLELNHTARPPFVYQIGGMLWQLPEVRPRKTYRLVYFLCPGEYIVFLHVCITAVDEDISTSCVEIALERLKNFLRREGLSYNG